MQNTKQTNILCKINRNWYLGVTGMGGVGSGGQIHTFGNFIK